MVWTQRHLKRLLFDCSWWAGHCLNAMVLHEGTDRYTNPAFSAKVHFITVGDITNAVNKTSRLGQWLVYFFLMSMASDLLKERCPSFELVYVEDFQKSMSLIHRYWLGTLLSCTNIHHCLIKWEVNMSGALVLWLFEKTHVHGFKSQTWILDGHFCINLLKKCSICLKRLK